MTFRADEVAFVPAIAEALAEILAPDPYRAEPLETVYTAVRKRVPKGRAPISTVKQVLRRSGAAIEGHQSTGGQIIKGVRMVAPISPRRARKGPDLDTRMQRAFNAPGAP